MEIVLALVEADHNNPTVMTEEEFNNVIDTEGYSKECDAQLCDDYDKLLG